MEERGIGGTEKGSKRVAEGVEREGRRTPRGILNDSPFAIRLSSPLSSSVRESTLSDACRAAIYYLRLRAPPWNPFPLDILENSEEHDDSVRLETVFLIFSGIPFRNTAPIRRRRMANAEKAARSSKLHPHETHARAFVPAGIIGF